MIDLYYWPTPNGRKVTLFLEEAEIEYTLKPVNIRVGEQMSAEFQKISPGNKIPAIVDHAPADGRGPITVFESGAILLYLAEKTGQFLSTRDARERLVTLQWLFWQVGGLGPMSGQMGHFHVYAPEKIRYAMERYQTETQRLLTVLDQRLSKSPYLASENYTIADMACYPWLEVYQGLEPDYARLPNVKRWHDAIAARPATVLAYTH